jgi:hypothetical protein
VCPIGDALLVASHNNHQKELMSIVYEMTSCIVSSFLYVFSGYKYQYCFYADFAVIKGRQVTEKNILIPNVAEKNILILVEGKQII